MGDVVETSEEVEGTKALLVQRTWRGTLIRAWYIDPECLTTIGFRDVFCRGCGRRLRDEGGDVLVFKQEQVP